MTNKKYTGSVYVMIEGKLNKFTLKSSSPITEDVLNELALDKSRAATERVECDDCDATATQHLCLSCLASKVEETGEVRYQQGYNDGGGDE